MTMLAAQPAGERDRRLAQVADARRMHTARRRAMSDPRTAVPMLDEIIGQHEQAARLSRIRQQVREVIRRATVNQEPQA